MKRCRYILPFVVLLTGLSCSKETELPEDRMQFNPSLPFSSTKATDTAFEPSDAIGIYVVDEAAGDLELSGNWANNAKGVFDGQDWDIAPAIYWKGESRFNVYSYYPYSREVNSVEDFRFPLQLDQRGDGYTLSDFMWAKCLSASREDGPVDLHFTHRLSRIDVNLVKGEYYEGELPQDAVVKIHGTVPVALVDLKSGDIVKDPEAVSAPIIARNTASGSYSAIVVPQKLLSQVPLIEVIINDVSYLVSSKFIFEAGVRHSVDVVLSDNPDKVVINVGGGIDEWN